VTTDYPSWVEEAWLQSLRFEKPSVLAQREDLNPLRHRIEIALASREGSQRALKEALEALGAGKLDKAAAYGGLAFAAIGTIGLLAGGPVTWLVAAGAAGTAGGSAFAIVGGARMWRHTEELERLQTQQRRLTSETDRFTRAFERVTEAIELQKYHQRAN